jgi:hypothetical protein
MFRQQVKTTASGHTACASVSTRSAALACPPASPGGGTIGSECADGASTRPFAWAEVFGSLVPYVNELAMLNTSNFFPETLLVFCV